MNALEAFTVFLITPHKDAPERAVPDRTAPESLENKNNGKCVLDVRERMLRWVCGDMVSLTGIMSKCQQFRYNTVIPYLCVFCGTVWTALSLV